MSVTAGRNIVRRFTGLLPLVVIAALFAAPLIIWLVKNDEPAIVTERLKGRIVAVSEVPGRTSSEQAMKRVTVTLEGGTTVEVDTDASELRVNDDVVVVRTRSPDELENLTLDKKH